MLHTHWAKSGPRGPLAHLFLLETESCVNFGRCFGSLGSLGEGVWDICEAGSWRVIAFYVRTDARLLFHCLQADSLRVSVIQTETKQSPV